MYKIKVIVIILLFNLVFVKVKAQINFDHFIKYLGKNIKLPDSLKYDCNWHYAIVKTYTNKDGKIIKYECLNPVKPEFSASFKFIVGYKFPKDYKIRGVPVIFYFSYDNSEICKYGSSTNKKNQNDIASDIWSYLSKIQNTGSKTIIIPNTFLTVFYAPQP